MSKNTINIFDEERITHKGEKPDVKVLLDKISNDGINIKVEVNLERHNFEENCTFFFKHIVIVVLVWSHGKWEILKV